MHYLGTEWVLRRILPEDSKLEEFIRIDVAIPATRALHRSRVAHLAELMVNLQHVPGFAETILPSLRDKEIEPVFAELMAGERVQRLGLDFAFRPPNSVRGESFDLDIVVGGLHLCGETKCKVITTAPAEKTLINVIGRARSKNLPNDQPGVVFVLVPQHWMEPGFFSKLVAAIEGYLETAGRLVAVSLGSWIYGVGKDTVESAIIWRTVINRQSRYYDPRVEALAGEQVQPIRWMELPKLWEDHLR